MAKSITYHLTMLVIKIKGIKKIFSQNPINYLELRKGDIHFPKSSFFKSKKVSSFSVEKTQITEVKNEQNSKKLLIFIHGGAFVSGPAQHHWDSVEKIAKKTNYCVWVCDYPKAPEHKISEISRNINAVYELAISKFSSENIVLLGDSVGGTLVVALTQRLIEKKMPLPSKLLLISPVMDASFENPDIDAIDKKDPMISKAGVLSAKKMCIEDGNLKNVTISPIYGSFQGFPTTFLFLAENDITYPDQLLLCNALERAKVENTVFLGEGMPHIWPLLPVMKEARVALDKIIGLLNE